MKRRAYVFILFFIIFITSLSANKKFKLTHLNPEFQEWYKMVSYIATGDEKRIFEQLKTDRERQIFIHLFWNQRDPTIGTQENEYKDKIYLRFIHVNKYFGHGTPKKGWQTSMGEIYMILGPPESTNKMSRTNTIVPTEIWFYRGMGDRNLPDYFNIVFFKPEGVGEWQLYSPSDDGPAMLLKDKYLIDNQNYQSLYQSLKKISPQLASASISMIPGERPYKLMPNIRSNSIISNIYQSPARLVNTEYATNFLNYQGFVHMKSTTRFIPASFTAHLTRDEISGHTFLNYTLKPSKVSLAYSKDQDKYFFSFDITITLKEGDKQVFTYSKKFDSYINKDDIGLIESKGILISDYFPIIPGKYSLKVFVENKVGNDLSFVERDLLVPSDNNPVPHFISLLVSYKKEKLGFDIFYPYKYQEFRLSVDPQNTFSLKKKPIILLVLGNLTESLRNNGYIMAELSGMDQSNKYFQQQNIEFKNAPFRKIHNIFYSFPEQELNADYYRLKFTLYNQDKKLIDSIECQFTISPNIKISEPVEVFSKILTNNTYYFDYQLGIQYNNSLKLSVAERYFKRSYLLNSTFKQSLVELMNIYLKQKKYSEILNKIEDLKGDKNFNFSYHFIKGKGYFGLNQFRKGLECFLDANQIANSNYHLINLIGLSYLKLGEKDLAVKAFKASLKLNKNQPLLSAVFQKYQIEIN